jgi:hypothetical protein
MSTTPNTLALSANLPAQVTLASEHVTGSYGKAPARPTVASPRRSLIINHRTVAFSLPGRAMPTAYAGIY